MCSETTGGKRSDMLVQMIDLDIDLCAVKLQKRKRSEVLMQMLELDKDRCAVRLQRGKEVTC